MQEAYARWHDILFTKDVATGGGSGTLWSGSGKGGLPVMHCNISNKNAWTRGYPETGPGVLPPPTGPEGTSLQGMTVLVVCL